MTLSYESTNPSSDDVGYLKALSICYYVLAGLMGLGGLCMTVYMGFFTLMFNNFAASATGPGAPPAGFTFMVILIFGAEVLLLWGFAVCLFLAGRRMMQRRSYVFILVIAGISCLNVPLGTVLGVFTFVVLQRPTVRVLFGRQ